MQDVCEFPSPWLSAYLTCVFARSILYLLLFACWTCVPGWLARDLQVSLQRLTLTTVQSFTVACPLFWRTYSLLERSKEFEQTLAAWCACGGSKQQPIRLFAATSASNIARVQWQLHGSWWQNLRRARYLIERKCLNLCGLYSAENLGCPVS